MKSYKVEQKIIGMKVPYLAMETKGEKVDDDFGFLEDRMVFQLALRGRAPLHIKRCLRAHVDSEETELALICKCVFIGRAKAMKLYKAQLLREVENLPDRLTTGQINEIFNMKEVPANR